MNSSLATGAIFLVLRLGLAAALYAFLGWALITLWRDLKQSKKLIQDSEQPPQIWLEIGLIERSQGQVQGLRGPEVTLGRDPACTCQLTSDTVSARHARLTFHHGHWWLEDLNSRNGTLLNDQVITSPVVVAADDEIRCGDVRIVVLEESHLR